MVGGIFYVGCWVFLSLPTLSALSISFPLLLLPDAPFPSSASNIPPVHDFLVQRRFLSKSVKDLEHFLISSTFGVVSSPLTVSFWFASLALF